MLRQFDRLGVDLFRINMSHTPEDALGATIAAVRAVSATPLCIDTEGPQVRTGRFRDGSVDLVAGTAVRLVSDEVLGDQTTIPLRPRALFEHIAAGTMISVDFNAVLLLVTAVQAGRAEAKVVSGGHAGTNKGVSVDRELQLAPLSEKDLAAIPIALAAGISVFALSFAADAGSVEALRRLVGPSATIISKIESAAGLAHADEILRASDAILVDRGDLSRDVPVEQLPFIQRHLVEEATRRGRPIYVATNLLESMTRSPHPTRAEVNDIISTLLDGASGLVLAAETAIGLYPVRCVRMVRRIVNEYRSRSWATVVSERHWLGNGMLESPAIPHGGVLVSRVDPLAEHADLRELPRLRVGPSVSRDVHQVAHGVYSPITGFMGREEVEAVLEECRLPGGAVWPLPVVLPARRADVHFGAGTRALLECECCDRTVAAIDVRDVWEFDPVALTRRWFGTTDAAHPGVSRLLSAGDVLIGGEIVALTPHPFAPIEDSLTPAQTRAIFAHNGWDTVVGFHSRNAPHRAHEHVQLEALRRVSADALFINPALGRKKAGDFTAQAILAGYKALLPHLPAGRALVSGFFSDSWYAGPREAVFTALCRKNFGCSHFIVGRDHTGVSDFYGADEVLRLFERLGDVGIEPVFFGKVAYDAAKARHVEADDPALLAISATAARQELAAGRRPAEWLMRREVSDAILALGPAAFSDGDG